MKKLAQAVAVTLAIGMLGVCVLKAAVYWNAFRQQRRAERLLVAIQNLRPGVTTVSDLQRDVFPLNKQFSSGCGGETGGKPGYADYINEPDWKLFNNEHTPASIREFEIRWILPRWTMFSVSITCRDSLLSTMRVTEMQGSPEWLHGFSNDTKFLPQGTRADEGVADQRPQDKAYWTYQRGTGVYSGNALVRESPILNRFIFLSPDATAEEQRRALDFHLDCFTRWHGCQNVDLILTPAPKRP